MDKIKAVFIPLNGGVTLDYRDWRYPERMKFKKESIQALARFQKEGWKIILYCTWPKNVLTGDFATICQKKLFGDYCINVSRIVFWEWEEITDGVLYELAVDENIDLSKSWVLSSVVNGVCFCDVSESRLYSAPRITDVPRLIEKYC